MILNDENQYLTFQLHDSFQFQIYDWKNILLYKFLLQQAENLIIYFYQVWQQQLELGFQVYVYQDFEVYDWQWRFQFQVQNWQLVLQNFFGLVDLVRRVVGLAPACLELLTPLAGAEVGLLRLPELLLERADLLELLFILTEAGVLVLLLRLELLAELLDLKFVEGLPEDLGSTLLL